MGTPVRDHSKANKISLNAYQNIYSKNQFQSLISRDNSRPSARRGSGLETQINSVFPPSQSLTLGRRKVEGICSGQFSIFLEIMTRVLLPKGTPSGQRILHRVQHGHMKKLSRFHLEVTFSPESLSQTLDQSGVIPQSGGSSLRNEIFHKDCRFYAGYNLTTRSSRFTDSVTLLDYPNVQTLQCPYINADYCG